MLRGLAFGASPDEVAGLTRGRIPLPGDFFFSFLFFLGGMNGPCQQQPKWLVWGFF